MSQAPRIITDGYARQEAVAPNGSRTMTVRHLIPGDIIFDWEYDELHLCIDIPLHTDAIETGPAQERLWRQQQRDLQFLSRNTLMPVGDRLIDHLHWLLTTPKQVLGRVQITHEELARDVGAMRESVTKEMRALAGRGVIDQEYGRILLLQPRAAQLVVPSF